MGRPTDLLRDLQRDDSRCRRLVPIGVPHTSARPGREPEQVGEVAPFVAKTGQPDGWPTDLLAGEADAGKEYRIRQDFTGQRGIYVENLTIHEVGSFDHAMQLLTQVYGPSRW